MKKQYSWWMFWNPDSGLVGGVIAGLVLVGSAYLVGWLFNTLF